MAIKISSLMTDPAKEQDGVWVPFESGVELLLARVGNPRYYECVHRLMRERGVSGAGLLPEVIATDPVFVAISRRAMAETIVLGWRGQIRSGGMSMDDREPAFLDDAGTEIPYSVEAAERLLEGSSDFERFVGQRAMGREVFRRDEVEAQKGNSAPASVGT